MPGGRKRIMIFFTGRKKQKAWKNSGEKYKPVKRRSFYNKDKCLEEVWDGKGAFYKLQRKWW